MSLEIKYTTQFKKDLKLSKKQGKDIDELFEVVDKLAKGEKLDSKYKDHSLIGNYSACRECHIEPDWLLIYEIMNEELILMLYRAASHSDLY